MNNQSLGSKDKMASPLHQTNFLTTNNSRLGVSNNERAGLSQTSKFIGGVQQSAQNADKLTDLSDLMPNGGLNGT
jgi:hypothetical protein